MAVCTSDNVKEIQTALQNGLQLLRTYQWAIDSYVLDFFTQDHWQRIPLNWRNSLAGMKPEEMAVWLQNDKPWNRSMSVFPLELLALRASLKTLSLERSPIKSPDIISQIFGISLSTPDQKIWASFEEEFNKDGSQCKSLRHIFRKHVKPKKQYEVARMADVTDIMEKLVEGNNKKILDIGSGVGHLSRLLAVKRKFDVICLDAESDFTSSAKRFDQDLKKVLNKQGVDKTEWGSPPKHLTFFLTPDQLCAKKLHHKIVEESQYANERYGILGLHTCGDLGPILISLFANSSNASFLQSVGCCYMKMNKMYPMSQFLHSQAWSGLSYTARELSCHAIEDYTARLVQDQEKLKVHCFRAILECLIRDKDPTLVHKGLKTVSRAHELPFGSYAKQATANIGLDWTEAELSDENSVLNRLEDWWKVVIFYSIRLSFAPVIETVMLLDRVLYLHEQGIQKVVLLPIFDPLKSPRNHVLLARK